MIRILILGVSILYGIGSCYATQVSNLLNKLNTDILTAEMWALECMKGVNKEKVTVPNCHKVNGLVKKADRKILHLMDYIVHENIDGPSFYYAVKKVKSYQMRLKQINYNLHIAKK